MTYGAAEGMRNWMRVGCFGKKEGGEIVGELGFCEEVDFFIFFYRRTLLPHKKKNQQGSELSLIYYDDVMIFTN